MIRVLIAEDSPVVAELIVHILSADPEVQVVGVVKNGEEVVSSVMLKQPDVVAMDVHMPVLNGFEATKRIMETAPLPIVVMSASWDDQGVEKTFRSLEAGALTAVEKPPGPAHPDYDRLARAFVETIKLMSEVKVVRRRFAVRPSETVGSPASVAVPGPNAGGKRIVAIGVSTGGPVVLQTILRALSQAFPVPVLIVQHIAHGFVRGMTEWLTQTTGFPVHIGKNGETVLDGHAYMAPDGHHLGIGRDGRLALSTSPPENGLRPAVSYLFRSVTEAYGAEGIGVLLTGMGKDGASELKQMKDKGAVTIVQDKESSVIHGMPGEAIKMDAATYIMTPEKTADMLVALVSRSQRPITK
ncbi:MAG: chemotaxis-specific protein-glutamate methyltransferase CheB [Syntrophales bacterium]|nr:chemotaxis-specific protein-glutamate methyltransferase CheB [Syntrophales bacterium]